jgi:hypothetical protein
MALSVSIHGNLDASTRFTTAKVSHDMPAIGDDARIGNDVGIGDVAIVPD